jgi:MFS transporter, Spinster family, sphingosine-1-phosphate transporter
MTNPRIALLLLLAVNLLNYIDRQVLYAVFPLVKTDLSLSDAQLGLLGSAFMLCYMCSAPLFGWLGDRKGRPFIAAAGVAGWSVATLLSGFAPGYRTLLGARTLVGVGEASFGTVSPGLLSEYFPPERRGRILSWFYLAIPLGSALGYLVGGAVGQSFGWQAAFLLVGAPGLLLAFPVARLREPQRTRERGEQPSVADYAAFFRNRSFVTTTLAMAAMTFAMGGLAQWAPSFLCRLHGLGVGEANRVFGGITVAAGITGTLAGGWLGDLCQRRSAAGYLLVSAAGFLFGAPLALFALLSGSLRTALAMIFVAEVFLFLNTGPLNTVLVGITPPPRRAMAFAVNIFFIHALGDAVSPALIGWVSDFRGLREALLLTPAAIVAAGLLSLLCTRWIREDMERAAD